MSLDQVQTPETSFRSHEHRTVSRITGILETVIASGAEGVRLADLAEILDAPKSSLHGLTKGLVAVGYLRDEKGRYYQGKGIALLALAGEQIPAAFHHALEELSEQTGETAILATMAGDSVVNIDIVESTQYIRASPPKGERRPMWPNSSGKVLLAFMEPRRRDSYLARKHSDPTEREQILRELEEIRSTGVSFNPGKVTPDLYGIACPIYLTGGDTTMTVALAGPSGRMSPRMEELATILRNTAQSLSTNG